ncbi:type I-C CRISPR-associated endonuclease Cas1c [Opitutales bacterium ASA1]|uniref:type I-C CRISPR-associated endonuclease Cas1c n=1 Tax=Congregicoccus parvus TaxID=3081749 RepID=UPI002B28DEB4|nr:type I-C CRISPR-associated endonuclease Cas1c [Opitutales bacterium ASA1]
MPQVLQNTLYLLTPGLALRRDGLALRIEHEKQLKLSLPIHNCESVFVFGSDIYVSPSAMRLCWEHGAAVCYFTDWGRLEARVEGVPQGSVLLRRAHHAAASDAGRTLSLARRIVAGKLHNTRWLLARSARDSPDAADAADLRAALDRIAFLFPELERAENLDVVRGCEGRAAAAHFDVFLLHLRPTVRTKFPMQGRNRRPPRDAVNCLLSFLYALLRHDCVSALAAVGLDPFVGFLHTDRAGRESLALDLMEEFRPWAERLAVTLINRGELKPGDFEAREGGAVELSEKARKAIVAAYQQRKLEETTHPLFQQRVRHGQLPFIQARLLARAIREEADAYAPFLFS